MEQEVEWEGSLWKRGKKKVVQKKVEGRTREKQRPMRPVDSYYCTNKKITKYMEAKKEDNKLRLWYPPPLAPGNIIDTIFVVTERG